MVFTGNHRYLLSLNLRVTLLEFVRFHLESRISPKMSLRTCSFFNYNISVNHLQKMSLLVIKIQLSST